MLKYNIPTIYSIADGTDIFLNIFLQEVDLHRILESLPSVKQVAMVVGIVYTLSKYSRVEVKLKLDCVIKLIILSLCIDYT